MDPLLYGIWDTIGPSFRRAKCDLLAQITIGGMTRGNHFLGIFIAQLIEIELAASRNFQGFGYKLSWIKR